MEATGRSLLPNDLTYDGTFASFTATGLERLCYGRRARAQEPLLCWLAKTSACLPMFGDGGTFSPPGSGQRHQSTSARSRPCGLA